MDIEARSRVAGSAAGVWTLAKRLQLALEMDRKRLWTSFPSAISTELRDDEYLMTDSTSSRIHQQASGPAGGQLSLAMGRSKASLSSKIHMVCDGLGYPFGFILTEANVSDFDQCKPLLKAYLYLRKHTRAIMDKGYDSDAIRAYVNQLGGVAVMALHPSRSQKKRL